MPLTVICGPRSAVNGEVLLAATQFTPALVIDSASCADPHMLLRFSLPELFDEIYVVEVDLLYKLRDVLLRAQELAHQYAVRKIIFTTFDRLFHYQDDVENNNMYEQIWLLLRGLGARFDVLVGVRAGTVHELYARKFGVVYGPYSAQPAASA